MAKPIKKSTPVVWKTLFKTGEKLYEFTYAVDTKPCLEQGQISVPLNYFSLNSIINIMKEASKRICNSYSLIREYLQDVSNSEQSYTTWIVFTHIDIEASNTSVWEKYSNNRYEWFSILTDKFFELVREGKIKKAQFKELLEELHLRGVTGLMKAFRNTGRNYMLTDKGLVPFHIKTLYYEEE